MNAIQLLRSSTKPWLINDVIGVKVQLAQGFQNQNVHSLLHS